MAIGSIIGSLLGGILGKKEDKPDTSGPKPVELKGPGPQDATPSVNPVSRVSAVAGVQPPSQSLSQDIMSRSPIQSSRDYMMGKLDQQMPAASQQQMPQFQPSEAPQKPQFDKAGMAANIIGALMNQQQQKPDTSGPNNMQIRGPGMMPTQAPAVGGMNPYAERMARLRMMYGGGSV